MNNGFNKTVIICKHILHSCYKKCFNNNNNTITINNSYDDYDINCYCGCINKNIEIKANTLCLYTESFHHVNILLLALLSLLAFIYVYTCYNPTKRLHRFYPQQYNTLMISNDSDSNNSNNSNNNSNNNNSSMNTNKHILPFEMYDENGALILLPPYDNNININTKTKNDNKTIHPPEYTI